SLNLNERKVGEDRQGSTLLNTEHYLVLFCIGCVLVEHPQSWGGTDNKLCLVKVPYQHSAFRHSRVRVNIQTSDIQFDVHVSNGSIRKVIKAAIGRHSQDDSNLS